VIKGKEITWFSKQL